MRFKQKPQPEHGDQETVTKFLWFPKKIHDETRWLEVATYEREYYERDFRHGWIDVAWKKDLV